MSILTKTIQYLTLIFIFLIPWQARWILVPGELNGGYWEYGTQSLYVTELLLLIVMCALVIYGGLQIHRKGLRFNMSQLWNFPSLLGMCVLWAGVSLLWALDRAVALEHWVMLVEASVVCLVVASGVIPQWKLNWTIIASGFIQAVCAIVQTFLQEIPASTILGMAHQSADVLGSSVVETVSGRWLRAYGSFPHPNMLGIWLVLSILLLIKETKQLAHEHVTRRLKQYRYALRYLIFFVVLFGLLATFSRSAWLALCISIAVGVLIAGMRKRFDTVLLIYIGISMVCVGLFSTLFPEQMLARTTGQGRLEVQSTTERLSSLEEAKGVIKDNWLIGVGIGNYTVAVHTNIDDQRPSFVYQPVHNTYILILAELGVIGALLIAYLLYLMTQYQRQVIENIIVVIPLLTIMLFDHYLWTLYSGVVIFLLILGIFVQKSAK